MRNPTNPSWKAQKSRKKSGAPERAPPQPLGDPSEFPDLPASQTKKITMEQEGETSQSPQSPNISNNSSYSSLAELDDSPKKQDNSTDVDFSSVDSTHSHAATQHGDNTMNTMMDIPRDDQAPITSATTTSAAAIPAQTPPETAAAPVIEEEKVQTAVPAAAAAPAPAPAPAPASTSIDNPSPTIAGSSTPTSGISPNASNTTETIAPAAPQRPITPELALEMLRDPNLGKKANEEMLVASIKALVKYQYLDKGLSTNKDKSAVTNTTNTLTELVTTPLTYLASYLVDIDDSSKSTTKFHMYDKVAKTNQTFYLSFIDALSKTTNDYTALLTKVKAIYASVAAINRYSLTTPRFQVIMQDLLNAFVAALETSTDKHQQDRFVSLAKTLFAPTLHVPRTNETNDHVQAFIKEGPSSPVDQWVQSVIAALPQTYAYTQDRHGLAVQLPEPVYNSMDADINAHLFRLHEHIKPAEENDQIDLHEIMHYLHATLTLFMKMRAKVGVEDGAEAFKNTAREQLGHLENYRKKTDAPALDQVRLQTIELAKQLTQCLADVASGAHKFEPDLALSYLNAVTTFCNQPGPVNQLLGASRAITAAPEKKTSLTN